MDVTRVVSKYASGKFRCLKIISTKRKLTAINTNGRKILSSHPPNTVYHVAELHLQAKHQIDLDSAACIIYSTVYSQRLTLEPWFTNLEQMPLNRSQQLPAPTKRLVDGLKQNLLRENDWTADNLTRNV